MAFQPGFVRRRDYRDAADRLGVGLAVIQAVAAVEGRGSGFIAGTDLPKILFEGHHFHRLTGGVHDGAAPSISYRQWTTEHYRAGKGEYHRLRKAMELDGDAPDAALKSASWGMFQILGSNHRSAGYDSVVEFVDWMSMGERHHLMAFVSFIEAEGLVDELRSQAWTDFARAYNGPLFHRHGYDTRIAQSFRARTLRLQEESTGGMLQLERGDMVQIQAALNLRVDAGLATDGWIGPKTRAAIRKFQAINGLPETGEVDARLGAALEVDLHGYTSPEAVA